MMPILKNAEMFIMILLIILFTAGCGGNELSPATQNNPPPMEAEETANKEDSSNDPEPNLTDKSEHDHYTNEQESSEEEEHNQTNEENQDDSSEEETSKEDITTPETTTPPAPSPKTHLVQIVDFAFSPNKLEINVGDIVKFVNKDGVRHTATADNKPFDTGLLGQNEEMPITFTEPGEFSYLCLPHPGMKGTIVVKKSN